MATRNRGDGRADCPVRLLRLYHYQLANAGILSTAEAELGRPDPTDERQHGIDVGVMSEYSMTGFGHAIAGNPEGPFPSALARFTLSSPPIAGSKLPPTAFHSALLLRALRLSDFSIPAFFDSLLG